MGGCKCTFRNCSNTSSNSPGMHFFHYPLKDKERCKKWIKNANNEEILNLPFSKARNKVVCETHFKDECFMNYKKERLVHYAVPTIVRLGNNCCLDYEESDKPVLKSLAPTNQIHLIPPSSTSSSSEQTKQVSNVEEEYILGLEQNDIELVSTTNSDSQIVIMNKMLPSKLKYNNTTPRILNSYFHSQPQQKEEEEIVTKYTSETDNTIDIEDICDEQNISEVEVILDNQDMENNEQETVEFVDTLEIIDEDKFHEEYVREKIRFEEENQVKKYGRNKKLKRILEDDLVIEKLDDQITQDEQIVTNEQIQYPKLRKIILENGIMKVVRKEEISSNSDSESNNVEVNVSNYNPTENIDIEMNKIEQNNLNEILEKDKRIKELEEELLKEKNKNKIKENASQQEQAQVETISTSRQTSSNSSNSNIQPTLTKVQLFKSIKKYLSPSMATLVRMEMFGGPDREWKSDEKQASIELLLLGDEIFKYLRDEWRFRLPPLKSVQQWLTESKEEDNEECL